MKPMCLWGGGGGGALGDTKGWLERENRMQLYCFIIQMVVNPFALLGEKLKFLNPYLAWLFF